MVMKTIEDICCFLFFIFILAILAFFGGMIVMEAIMLFDNK